MKQPHLCLGFLIYCLSLFTSTGAWGRDLTYYHSYSQKIQNITVNNMSSEPEDLWILIYEGKYIEEVHFEIPPLSKKNLSLNEFKNTNQELALLTKTDSLILSSNWNLNTSTAFKNTRPQTLPKKIEITNLSLSEQIVEVYYYNSKNEILSSDQYSTLGYLKTNTIEIKNQSQAHLIEVKSRFPIAIHPSTNFLPVIDESNLSTNKAQFLAEYEEGSQFIVQMTEPDLIKKAREEVQHPKGLIIFGDLAQNHSGNNRNPALKHQPKWNWELQEVTGLEPLAADWCQVYPEMIERMLSVLLDQEKVCFRGARLVREITQP